MSTVVLIRHGQTEANVRWLYCGATDLPLSQEGISQLVELKKSVPYPDPTGFRIVTSGMLRCEQTLEVLYGSIPHEAVPGLHEMNFGAFEMRSYEQMKEEPDYVAWISGDNDANLTPGGESGNLMQKRVLAAFEKLTASGQDLLIVAHGGPIYAMMEHLFPNEHKNRYDWQPKSGRGYIVTLGEERSYQAL